MLCFEVLYRCCKPLKTTKLEPFDLIEKANSLETFLDFIKALILDKRDEDEKKNDKKSSPYDWS